MPGISPGAPIAIERGASYRVIPWQMGVVARLMRLLPNAVYDRLARNAPRASARRADSVRPGRQRTTSLRVSPLTWLTSPQSSTCHSRPLTPTRVDADVQHRRVARRHAAGVAPNDVQHAAVREQHDALAAVASGDVVHRGNHARLELAQRFAAVQRAQRIAAFPGGRRRRGQRVDVFQIQPFQHAEAAFADAGLGADAQVQLLGHGLSGIAGALQIAAVEGVEARLDGARRACARPVARPAAGRPRSAECLASLAGGAGGSSRFRRGG